MGTQVVCIGEKVVHNAGLNVVGQLGVGGGRCRHCSGTVLEGRLVNRDSFLKHCPKALSYNSY